jgi:hypothetical protein
MLIAIFSLALNSLWLDGALAAAAGHQGTAEAFSQTVNS